MSSKNFYAAREKGVEHILFCISKTEKELNDRLKKSWQNHISARKYGSPTFDEFCAKRERIFIQMEILT